MSRFALFTNSTLTQALRFDDPEFLEAIAADAGQKGEGERQGPLAQLLGLPDAADFDFAPLADEGWTIHARPAITGAEEDRLYTNGQRAGGGVDLGQFNQTWWGLWVQRVTLPDTDDIPPAVRATLQGLSGGTSKARGEAFGQLPAPVRAAFRARLRVHVDAVSTPARRDSLKTAPKE